MTLTAAKPLIRQFKKQGEGCFGYVIADTHARKAVIIDPRNDQVDEYLSYLKSEGLELQLVIDTHTHADHLSGAAELKRRTGADYGMLAGTLVKPANRALRDGEKVQVGGIELEVLASPGHTPDSLTVAVDGNLFTGDTMLIGGSGRTDFMGGDAGELFDSFAKFSRFADDTLVWPGHDYQGRSHSTLGKERAHNMIFTLGTRDAVVEKLSVRGPLPQGMAEILTFNRNGAAPGAHMDCATVHSMLKDDPHSLQIVDVRTPMEVSGEGWADAWNIPLDELEDRITELNKARGTVVLTCESGNRALMAAQILQRRKFGNFKIMDGGMKGWKKAGLPYKKGRKVLPIMRQVQLGAGLLVLAGVALGTFVNPWFYAISGFVGAGLTLAGSTGFCGMALMLIHLPWNKVAPTTGGGTSGGCQAGGGASGGCGVGGAGGGCAVGG
ncbi:MAG: MBL fold metallo-hydrolase [Planctomycetes bacterium]|nr:MBL fold metallo-hydrolase [Planctomycetota bacterium]MCW8136629.1 MBL fold metallo-hydrolase [Planctomycetota bacterium]